MALKQRLLLPLAALLVATSAFAGAQSNSIQFSNVTVTGSLSNGTTWTTGNNDIDFTFTNAIVGDGQQNRTGNIVITYEARSASQMTSDELTIGILGALSGSGSVFFNELIEDVAGGGFIGSHNALLTSNSQLPYTHTIDFSRSSNHIKVKKTFTLTALDTSALDLAQVNLLEQRINTEPIPEPATMAGLALGLGYLVRRRKKRTTA